jgi:CHASE3 domain sensor protein
MIVSSGFWASTSIFIGALVVGIFLAGAGEIMMAVREIAFNTRKEPRGSKYGMLAAMASIYSWIGWIIVIGSIVVYIYSIVTGMKS